jgi:hypothetical protein
VSFAWIDSFVRSRPMSAPAFGDPEDIVEEPANGQACIL